MLIYIEYRSGLDVLQRGCHDYIGNDMGVHLLSVSPLCTVKAK